MSNSSAVEYWEKYALHAFDNTDSAVYSSCILLSPTKRVVPCTFCFTIKRDIFDLPSVIVGNVSSFYYCFLADKTNSIFIVLTHSKLKSCIVPYIKLLFRIILKECRYPAGDLFCPHFPDEGFFFFFFC